MNDTRLTFSSIYDICRPVSKDEFKPFCDEDTIYSRAEAPQFPPVSRLISGDRDEFIGCRTIYNTGTGSGPVLVRHANRGNSFVAHLKNALLVHDALLVVASGNRIVFPNSFNEFSPFDAINHYTSRSNMTYSLLSTTAHGGREWEHYLREPSAQSRDMVIEAPHVLMSNMVSMSYFHFMLDVVPRLWIYDEWPELRRLPVVISPMGEKFEQALADLIGIPRSQMFVIPANAWARFTFRHLIYPTGLCDRMMTRERLAFIRAKTAGSVERSPVPPRRRVYLSRSDRPYRTVGNEMEIRRILQDYGVEIHIGAMLSIEEQAKLFDDTELLIGVGGGGFTNMMFMRPGSVVLELTQRHPSVVDGGNIIFLELAALCGLNHLMLSSQWDIHNLERGVVGMCAEHPSMMIYDETRLRAAIEEALSLVGATA